MVTFCKVHKLWWWTFVAIHGGFWIPTKWKKVVEFVWIWMLAFVIFLQPQGSSNTCLFKIITNFVGRVWWIASACVHSFIFMHVYWTKYMFWAACLLKLTFDNWLSNITIYNNIMICIHMVESNGID